MRPRGSGLARWGRWSVTVIATVTVFGGVTWVLMAAGFSWLPEQADDRWVPVLGIATFVGTVALGPLAWWAAREDPAPAGPVPGPGTSWLLGPAGPSGPAAAASVPRQGGPLGAGPPVEFIGRHRDLNEVLAALRDPQTPLITLKGIGGIGKTALAQEAVHRAEAEGIFDSVFWHSAQAEKFVGEGVLQTEVADYSFDTLLGELLRQSAFASSADAPTAVKRQVAAEWLADERVLVVLDNLETVLDRDALVAALFEILGRGKILVTSREEVVHPRARTLPVDGLSTRDGIDFLTRTAERQNNQALLTAGQDILARIHRVAGGAPLAMLLMSGQMDYQPVGQVLRIIEEAGYNEVSYGFYSFVFRRTWSGLDLSARKVLVGMRHFEGSPTALAIMATVGMGDDEFYRAVSVLGRRSMIDMIVGHEVRYSLHPLTRYFVNTDIAERWK